MHFDHLAHEEAERLAREFLGRVWAPPHDLDAIDELTTEDYVITSEGKVIRGRPAFKAWVAEFHRVLPGATNRVLDVFADPTGKRVASRWVCTGSNNGLFGLQPEEAARCLLAGWPCGRFETVGSRSVGSSGPGWSCTSNSRTGRKSRRPEGDLYVPGIPIHRINAAPLDHVWSSRLMVYTITQRDPARNRAERSSR